MDLKAHPIVGWERGGTLMDKSWDQLKKKMLPLALGDFAVSYKDFVSLLKCKSVFGSKLIKGCRYFFRSTDLHMCDDVGGPNRLLKNHRWLRGSFDDGLNLHNGSINPFNCLFIHIGLLFLCYFVFDRSRRNICKSLECKSWGSRTLNFMILLQFLNVCAQLAAISANVFH